MDIMDMTPQDMTPRQGAELESAGRASRAFSRRRALQAAVAAGGAIYAQPLVETLRSADIAHAASAPPSASCGGCSGTYTLTLSDNLASTYGLGSTVTLLCAGNGVLSGTVEVAGGNGATFTLGGTVQGNGAVSLTIAFPGPTGNLTLTGQSMGACASITLNTLTPAGGATVALTNSSLIRQ